MPKPFRGEIWWADVPLGRGSEPSDWRPVLIIQNDQANQSERYHNTIALVISTSGTPVSFHIPLTPTAENGLSARSVIKCEQVMTISDERLDRCIGQISSEEMHLVNRAIKRVLDLE